MKRTYKLIASCGNEIVFDDRIQSDTPRNAIRELNARAKREGRAS